MDLVYNLACRFADRVEDTEDLVQETYLAAFRAWRDHRRPRRVEPWIATICLNLGRSRYRAKERRPIEVQIEDRDFRAPEVGEPELAAEATTDREALHQASGASRRNSASRSRWSTSPGCPPRRRHGR
jgi:RNA polymerase sigma factor (sigma-70 family)